MTCRECHKAMIKQARSIRGTPPRIIRWWTCVTAGCPLEGKVVRG